MYVIIRSQLSTIIDLIGPELSELSTLEFENAIFDFVYILTSTNINQSAPNVVKTSVTINSEISLIMNLIIPELCELFALEFAKIAESDFVYYLASANINQSAPNLATIYIPIRSGMSSIVGQIEPEHLELFALEFGKMADSDLVYTLASANINQSAPTLINIYVTIRSPMSSIMDLIGRELSGLFAFEFAKIAESDFVYTLASTNVDQLVPNMVTTYMTMRPYMSLIMGQIRK